MAEIETIGYENKSSIGSMKSFAYNQWSAQSYWLHTRMKWSHLDVALARQQKKKKQKRLDRQKKTVTMTKVNAIRFKRPDALVLALCQILTRVISLSLWYMFHFQYNT